MKFRSLIMIFAGLFISSCQKNITSVSISNQSGVVIKELRFDVFDQRKVWTNVGVDQSVLFVGESSSDSHYFVRVEFVGGKTIEKNIGYVTHGAEFRDQLVILSDDVLLRGSKPDTSRKAP